VLAAGASTRFGSPKQRLLLPGVLERVLASVVDEVVVVAGAHELETDARVVRCADWHRGPGASLRCGLAALRDDTAAAVVVLADGPRLSPDAVGRVVAAWRSGAGDVVAASYGGVRGHPVVLGRPAWRSVPDEGARALEPVLVACDDLGAPGDVDESPLHDTDAIDRRAAELVAKGTSRPEWQFRAADARLVLSGPPGAAEPAAVDALAARDAETARALLRLAANAVARGPLFYAVDDPPRFGGDSAVDVALARACGFVLVRETDRWERGTEPVGDAERLSFEPVGDEPFYEAMGMTLAGTEDRALRRLSSASAPATAARRAMAGLRRGPVEWELARDEDGVFAGVSAPALVGERDAVIGYVGVAPDRRGRGYAVALLARATRALVAARATPIRGDSDVLNRAMASAFRRLAYVRFARRFDLELEPELQRDA
jgi:CTP:molybdopterin cytidylyltransferase MocA/ribosomal protein S18 acetylase RimI-like enzyme